MVNGVTEIKKTPEGENTLSDYGSVAGLRNLNETLSSYRLSETKEIRTLVHYPSSYLKKFFSLLPSYQENFFLILGCACAQQVIFSSLH